MIIERKEFKDLIERFIKSQKGAKELYKTLNIDIYDSPLFENEGWFFDRLMECIVKEEFLDTTTDYLFPLEGPDIEIWDRPENPLKIYDPDQEEDVVIASIATIDDLYNYLFANDGFRTDYRTSK